MIDPPPIPSVFDRFLPEPAEPVLSGGVPTPAVPPPQSMLDILQGHIGIFLIAFLVTLLVTPIMRRLAVRHGIIDRPSEARKVHKIPIAYLGGVAVYLGILAAVLFSFIEPVITARLPFEFIEEHPSRFPQDLFPVAVIFGMTVIMVTGLWDDVAALSPRLKIAGQLFTAAVLALQDVGTKVAAGLLAPIGRMVGNETLVFHIPLPFDVPWLLGAGNTFDLVYWVGVVIIALFVLGACNASNLIDGLDGLCTGVTSIAAAGLLFVALMLAAVDDGPRDAARLTLALALLGATLGFLPHNFNQATIFLGDAGSLLLGFVTITLVLSLGDTGKTHLVIAGLIIYAVPIMDTVLAMVRRKLAGRPLHAPDDQHLHHQLKRLFGIKGAVFTLYAIGALFAVLGVWLSTGRVRVVMTIALVIGAFIGVIAVKVARRQAVEAAAAGAVPLSAISGRPSVVAAEEESRHHPAAPDPADRPAAKPV